MAEMWSPETTWASVQSSFLDFMILLIVYVFCFLFAAFWHNNQTISQSRIFKVA